MNTLTASSPVQSAELWRNYKNTSDVEDRNVIVERYLPLVRKIAAKIASSLPDNITADDLFGSGVMGLIDAVEKYDTTLNVQFTTYARYRIRGAIYDELRKADWIPRSMRQKAKNMENTINDLSLKTGRNVSNDEIARMLNITEQEVNRIRGQMSNISIVSLDGFRETDENSYRTVISDDSVYANPEKSYEKVAIQDIIYDALLTLKERDRLVLTLYYYEELTLKEIGKILGVTESRVCQMHARSLKKIREYLENKFKNSN